MNLDPYLHQRYDEINATPMQRKLRRLAPIPVGAVFLPWAGMKMEDMRAHFRKMKALGFTCLKQTMPSPEWPEQVILETALEEGICPFWFDRGGWQDITPELLKSWGLNPQMDLEQALENETVHHHQNALMKQRIQRFCENKLKVKSARSVESAKKVPGVVGDVKGHELHEAAIPAFIEWLKEQYGDVENLKNAWNTNEVGISNTACLWKTWEDVQTGFLMDIPEREYRHLRDIMRFRADTFNREWIALPSEAQAQSDPDMPCRTGGEMGLFLSFPSRGTDMEAQAKLMAKYGSFYPSIHLAWHFEEVEFEVARPVYMQSRITSDWAKGIWTATWESTGGPQYFSGGKSPFVEEAANKVPGFTVDEHSQTQLMLSWLAGGFKGFGLWCWNIRRAGWEAGEFALTDRNGEVTPRAIAAGKIGRAAQQHRHELWQAHNEPEVGVMVDWENEAMCAAQAVTGRDRFKSDPVRARIGISRALINQQVPWEYITPANLFDGLGPRYKSIYLPYCLSIREELLFALKAYVEQGGRLVLDMPGAYFDGYGRMLPTQSGSLFEQIFGTVLVEYTFSNPKHTPLTIDGISFEGFAANLKPTTAKTLAIYNNERPAITENKLGKGSAVILGAQTSLNCHKCGQEAQESLMLKCLQVKPGEKFSANGVLAYRLASTVADHYFLINDEGAKTTALLTPAYQYTAFKDALTGEDLKPNQLYIPAHSGLWIRAIKGHRS